MGNDGGRPAWQARIDVGLPRLESLMSRIARRKYGGEFMSRERTMSANSLFGEMFQVGLYKPSQGRITRQTTCGSLWFVTLVAAWRLYATLYAYPTLQYALPFALIVVGLWSSYRLVNYPRFADFLIAVEAEMNKVSWPSWPELTRSSLVVIFVMIALAVAMLAMDSVWTVLFKNLLGILK
jgi:preprotein translocase subunit SecE